MGRKRTWYSLKGIALTVAAVLLWASAGIAAGPMWMPSFPMRMGTAGVMLMWMPVPGATEYKVSRKIGEGPWQEVFKGAANTFQDPAAPQDQDVSYKVVAVTGGKDGEDSPLAVLKGLKPIDPPANFAARVMDQKASLRWDVPTGASFYNVYRGTAPEGPFELIGSVQDSKFVDAKVEDGKTYYYVVTAVSTANQESKKPAPTELKVEFPKVVVEKKFDPVRRKMTLLKKSRGEDFAEFNNPSGIAVRGGRVYVADENGVQVLDADGAYVERLPLVQQMVTSREWPRPMLINLTPQGTILLSFINSPTIRELDAAGGKVLREITLPPVPDNDYQSSASGMDLEPDGRVLISDQGHVQLVVVANDGASPADFTRLGWAIGAKKPWDEKEFRFKGASAVRYLPQIKAIGVLQPGSSTVILLDPTTLKPLATLGGSGSGLNKLKSIGDFVEYDDQSVVVVDVLDRAVKRLKRDGDYLESFVDDPEKLNLAAPGSISRAAWDPKTKRLYVLSAFDSALYVYGVE